MQVGRALLEDRVSRAKERRMKIKTSGPSWLGCGTGKGLGETGFHRSEGPKLLRTLPTKNGGGESILSINEGVPFRVWQFFSLKSNFNLHHWHR